MMKKTLCLLFALALIAQICAIPTETENNPIKDAEKAVKGAAGQAAAAANEAKKDATAAVEQATNPEHAKIAKRNEDQTEHEGAKHGGEGSHKRGAGLGRPLTRFVKGTEEATKKVADAGVGFLTDFLGLLKL